jgi:hypothetical protein
MELLTSHLSRCSRQLWLCRECRSQIQVGRSRPRPAGRIRAEGGSTRWHVRRSLQTSAWLKDQDLPRRQAQALGDFYTDLLSTPIPKESAATSDLPTFVKSGDETKEERAAKLFGNIHGSGYERKVPSKPDATWRTINGVPIPPRPNEPDNCCMSGCMHCVWDDYRDDIEDWANRLKEAQAKGANEGQMSTPKVDMHRPEVAAASGSMDDDGGGSESLWDAPSSTAGTVSELFADIPVGIREFMATEKRLRERKRARKEMS